MDHHWKMVIMAFVFILISVIVVLYAFAIIKSIFGFDVHYQYFGYAFVGLWLALLAAYNKKKG